MAELAQELLSKFKMDVRSQNTLKRAVTFTGIGIHTGHRVTLTFVPAKEGSGIVFKRTDLEGAPTIPATADYALDTSGRNTTIGIGDVKVHTVEHVLAALNAFEIDNVIVELDAPEPPVGNGSSDVFVDLIEEGGVESQNAPKPIFFLDQPLFLSEGSVHIVALPHPEFKISYTLHYPQVKTIGSQFHSLTISSESFKQELSACRTFALYKELKMLMDAGLIRGGSLDNAVVVHDDAIFSKEGLKFPNEMVRHKILDMVGDLSLTGFGIRAHIISICSGHATNVAFAKKLLNLIRMEKI